MNENVTDSDVFINTYIKKQEDFIVKMIREKLELETKLQLVQTALIEKINEKNNVDELLKQSVNGVQTLTIERDNLKKEIDSSTERSEAFRKKCEQLTNSLVEEQNKTRELTIIKNDYDTLKINYNLVKNSHETLQSKLDELQAEKIIKKKKT
jgi:predicted RNase H-like nuclease (RuvC/YqgF family)